MDAIRKYSPFHRDEDLVEQFGKIEGDNGTLFVCYNLQLMDNGQSEFDIETDLTDIKMAESKVDATNRK